MSTEIPLTHHADSPRVPAENHLPAHLVAALGLGAAGGFGYVVGDWVSAGFLLLVVLRAYTGYWAGGIKIASGVMGLLAAIKFSRLLAPHVAVWSDQYVDLPPTFQEPLSIAAAGLLLVVSVVVTMRVLGHLLLASKPRWKSVDRWVGLTAGGMQGVLIGLIVLFGIVMLEPVAAEYAKSGQNLDKAGPLASWPTKVAQVSEQIRESSIGTVMESMEPVRERFNSRFDEMRKSVETKRESVQSPHRSQLMRMVQEIQADPAARHRLQSTLGVDDNTLRTILDAPEFERHLLGGQ